MPIEHPHFAILGCASPEPAIMPLDSHGPLREQPFAHGVGRLRQSLRRNVSAHDTYVRILIQVPVSADFPDGVMPSTKAMADPNRWICGEEAAEAVLNAVQVERALAVLQARPSERNQMITFLGEELAPQAPGPRSPFLAPEGPRRSVGPAAPQR
jgi:hypothetical protein